MHPLLRAIVIDSSLAYLESETGIIAIGQLQV